MKAWASCGCWFTGKLVGNRSTRELGCSLHGADPIVGLAVVLSVEMMVVFILLLMGALVGPVFQGLELPWESPRTEILNSPKCNLDTVPTSLELTSEDFG